MIIDEKKNMKEEDEVEQIKKFKRTGKRSKQEVKESTKKQEEH